MGKEREDDTYVQLSHADVNEGAEHYDKIKRVPRVSKIVLEKYSLETILLIIHNQL